MNSRLSIILCILITACNSSEEKKGAAILPTDHEFHNAINDQPAKTLADFLRWYDVNGDSLKKIKVIRMELLEDGTPNYVVDHQQLRRFENELEKSHFVSPRYRHQLHNYVLGLSRDDEWLIQNDSIADGLQTDLILHSADHGEVLSQIDDSTVDSLWVNGNKGKVKLGLLNGTKLTAFLSLHKKHWYIDSIVPGPKNYR